MTSYIQWCPEWLAMHRMARQELSPHPCPAYAIQCGVVTNFIKTRILKKCDKINFFGNNCKLTHKLPCHQSLIGFIFSTTKPEELVFAPHYNRRRPRQ